MKRTILSLVALAFCLISHAETRSWSHSGWTLTFDTSSKYQTLSYNGTSLFTNLYCSANYWLVSGGNEVTLTSTSAASASVAEADVSDSFGTGRQIRFTYTFSGGGSLVQDIRFYTGVPYLVTQVTVRHTSGAVKSNAMYPLCTTTTSNLMNGSSNTDNRMLWVPFDNDEYVNYQSRKLTTTHDSHNVIAVFNGSTRQGLVAGAVDHDHWKSVVSVTGKNYYQITAFALRSGFTDSFSHDSGMSHGKVQGTEVSSSRFIVGWFSDWREGMETYGQACARVVKPWAWHGSKPVGWNSWGGMQTNIQYENRDACVTHIAEYLHDQLQANGYHDPDGRVVFGLDSWWDFVGDDNVRRIFSYCRANHMIPGGYFGPWCDWGSDPNSVAATVDGTTYYYRDIFLKQNGSYKQLDGAYCLDPTHPATLQKMREGVARWKSLGVQFLKIDFLSQGAIEADSWYAPHIHTGIEAYNYGMEQFKAELQKQFGEGNLFVDFSISPIFPFQYGHSRRVSCDTYNMIGETKYCMNSSSFGWWTDQFYFANNPDQLGMIGINTSGSTNRNSATEGENRARLTSGAVTGMFMLTDNFSGTDYTETGKKTNTALSKTRAEKFIKGNTNLMHLVNTCRAFRPVFGHHAGESGAENYFTYETSQYVYLACINYSSTRISNYGVYFSGHLGIDPGNVGDVIELWGNSVSKDNDKINVTCAAKDAVIYRITKRNGTDDTPEALPANVYEKKQELNWLHRCTPSIADYNNDGRMDIYYGGEVWEGTYAWDVAGRLYTQLPDGSFTEETAHASGETAPHGLPPSVYGYSRWFDYNNDGNLDCFLVTRSDNNLQNGDQSLLYRNGGAANGYKFSLAGGASFINGANEHPDSHNSVNNRSVSFADYDRDGFTDVVQQAWGNGREAVVFHNNGDGTFTRAAELTKMTHGAVVFGDLDNDGWPDIVETGWEDANHYVEFYIFRNLGNGSFETMRMTDRGFVGMCNSDVCLVDLNGDGRLDIVATGNNGGARTDIYMNQGNFSFTHVTDHGIAPTDEGTIHAADLNYDGRPDLIITGTTGVQMSDAETDNGEGTRIYLQNAEGYFELRGTTGLPIMWQGGLALGDLSGRNAVDAFVMGNGVASVFHLAQAPTTSPSAPTGLQAVKNADGSLTVTWQAASEEGLAASALSYNVYVRDDETGAISMLLPADTQTGRLRTLQDMQNTVRGTLSYTMKPQTGKRFTIGVQTLDPSYVPSAFATTTLSFATPGDVNKDGTISIADVTALVNIILGKDDGETPQFDHSAADVNEDGSVSIADVTALVNIILGKS